MRFLDKKLNFSVLFTLLFCNAVETKAQNIANESANGIVNMNSNSYSEKSKIFTENSFDFSNITFNTKDARLGLNYYSYIVRDKKAPIYLNVVAAGKVKNDIANIFSSNNVVGEGEFRVNYGIRIDKNENDYDLSKNPTDSEMQSYIDNKTSPANELWLVINSTFNGFKFKRFDKTLTFENQIIKENFTGYNFNFGVNYWNFNIKKMNFVGGATIGIKRTSNFDDLDENSREDKQTITDALTNTVREVVYKETVYTGSYKEYTVYPINTNFFLAPHKLKNLSISLYSTTDIRKDFKPKTGIGVGFFVLKDLDIFNPVGGITFSLSDTFNVDKSDDDKGFSNKLTIALTTKINIFNGIKKE